MIDESQMKVRVICRKYNSSAVKIYIITPKPRPVAKNATPKPFGGESNTESRGRGFDSQPEGLRVAFFATDPSLGLIMYIFTTLEFPTHNSDFHLLTYIYICMHARVYITYRQERLNKNYIIKSFIKKK